MNHFISKTLNIKDENIIFEEKVEKMKYKGILSLFYYGELTYTPSECQCCGKENKNYMVIKTGKKQSRITLPHISELPAYFILKKQRFYCKGCGGYFTAQSPIIDQHCFISRNTKMAVLNKATAIRSESSIAQDCSVSPSTVSRFIDEAAESIHQSPHQSLSKHLMMDEFKSVKNVSGSMSFIYVDSLTHCIIDIIEDRRLKSLKDYFYRFSLKERKRVQTVSIDMYQPYIVLIQELFPNAKIIIDRFHIVQSLNRALNMARVAIMNSFKNTHRPLYNKFKRYWKLYLKPTEELEAFEYRNVPLFKSWKTQKGIVQFLNQQDETLSETYSIVNQLRCHLNHNDIEAFNRILESIQLSNVHPKLKPVIRTLKRYIPFITNTVDYSNFTNGPIEGINNKIKLIKRVSFGYSNYEHFRNRIILISRLYASEKKKEVKQQQVA